MGTYHNWSEKDFDWDSLNKAILYIGRTLRRCRVSVHQYKEKYGTARVYCAGLGIRQLHDLFYPGYYSSQFPDWLWKLDIYYGKYIVGWMNIFMIPFHKWLYRKVYQTAVDRYPHLKEEILVMADYQELVEGIHGYRHDDYWRTCK